MAKNKDNSTAITLTIGLLIIIVGVIVLYFLLKKKADAAKKAKGGTATGNKGNGANGPAGTKGTNTITDQMMNDLIDGTVETGSPTDGSNKGMPIEAGAGIAVQWNAPNGGMITYHPASGITNADLDDRYNSNISAGMTPGQAVTEMIDFVNTIPGAL